MALYREARDDPLELPVLDCDRGRGTGRDVPTRGCPTGRCADRPPCACMQACVYASVSVSVSVTAVHGGAVSPMRTIAWIVKRKRRERTCPLMMPCGSRTISAKAMRQLTNISISSAKALIWRRAPMTIRLSKEAFQCRPLRCVTVHTNAFFLILSLSLSLSLLCRIIGL